MSLTEGPKEPKTEKTSRLVRRIHALMLAVAVFALSALAGGSVTKVVLAAQYQEPSGQPPTGNIPVTVWNALDLPTGTEAQAAAIFVSGGGPPPARVGLQVGTKDLDMGASADGQNLVYGVTDFDKMSAGDRLMLLQTVKDNTYTDRMVVNKTGDLYASGAIVSGGNLNTDSCFGPTFQGLTTTTYTGNLNSGTQGYYAASTVCAEIFGAGAHVCSSAEMMSSLKCSTAFPPHKIRDAALSGSDGWIQDGPPGYTAPAQDCMGWRSNAPGNLGRMWRFDAATGGQGYLTTCNQAVRFACCR
ncbi:MAG: hypothetical protein PHT12_02655 [Patescibacteria group bacterium]|nr:hypothetical protein [Patescibacteria group bacterium]